MPASLDYRREGCIPKKSPKLDEGQRRTIARAAVHAKKYGDIAELARSYSITRSAVYKIRKQYTDLEKLERLEDEAEFRRALIREVGRST
jgi:hypothetical protein